MKIKAKLAIILTILFVTVCVFSACSDSEDKVFSKAGMSITLTDEFYENDYYNITAHYEMADEDVTVAATKEEISMMIAAGDEVPESVEEYASLIMEDNDIDADVLTTDDGIVYFVFKRTPYDIEYVYYAAVFETYNAFWLFQFGCEAEAENAYKDRFMTWMRSIQFE